jgi:hypothetical protein
MGFATAVGRLLLVAAVHSQVHSSNLIRRCKGNASKFLACAQLARGSPDSPVAVDDQDARHAQTADRALSAFVAQERLSHGFNARPSQVIDSESVSRRRLVA